jgi:very-long-chain enoyl-CoA reductase
VPPFDYLGEYLYYWGFAYWIARGLRGAGDGVSPDQLTWLGCAFFVLGEVGNTWAHQRLRALRSSSGSAEKKVPRGGLFELVSCPHYLFEITRWVGFSLLSRVLGAYAFLALGSLILASYARARHLAYRKEFDGQSGRALYPPTRRALVPFIF